MARNRERFVRVFALGVGGLLALWMSLMPMAGAQAVDDGPGAGIETAAAQPSGTAGGETAGGEPGGAGGDPAPTDKPDGNPGSQAGEEDPEVNPGDVPPTGEEPGSEESEPVLPGEEGEGEPGGESNDEPAASPPSEPSEDGDQGPKSAAPDLSTTELVDEKAAPAAAELSLAEGNTEAVSPLVAASTGGFITTCSPGLDGVTMITSGGNRILTYRVEIFDLRDPVPMSTAQESGVTAGKDITFTIGGPYQFQVLLVCTAIDEANLTIVDQATLVAFEFTNVPGAVVWNEPLPDCLDANQPLVVHAMFPPPGAGSGGREYKLELGWESFDGGDEEDIAEQSLIDPPPDSPVSLTISIDPPVPDGWWSIHFGWEGDDGRWDSTMFGIDTSGCPALEFREGSPQLACTPQGNAALSVDVENSGDNAFQGKLSLGDAQTSAAVPAGESQRLTLDTGRSTIEAEEIVTFTATFTETFPDDEPYDWVRKVVFSPGAIVCPAPPEGPPDNPPDNPNPPAPPDSPGEPIQLPIAVHPQTGPQAAPPAPTATRTTQLSDTGGHVGGLAASAAAVMVLGAILVLYRRRVWVR